MLSFSQCDIFPQWLHNSLYNNVYSISSTYIRYCYNYTTQYTDFAYTYAILFTIWYFFTITAQLTLQQYFQHILNIYLGYCLQLHYPVCWLCCLHMLSFSQCEYSSTHYCTIVYMTMFTFNLLCLHSVLFTITLHSILIVLCIYILSFHNDNVLTITITLHCNNVYSERSPFTYSRVYNYTIQYTDFAVYICCPFHNVIFFHNYCTIDSTTMSIAYP